MHGNNLLQIVEEFADSLVKTYAPSLVKVDGYNVLIRSDYEQVKQTQVALISGGGSGHEPAHAGFIGAGMLSAAVLGNVFSVGGWGRNFQEVSGG